ncbi:MAG TPA: glutathione peroxidase, partial [Clostridia bacterium]|nr:glutathione peroxidase [Clostridia bacterium]
MEQYRGRTLLIVNTASKCVFSPQYGELQKLYEEYRDWGFEILGFPCNQFANQEPGSEEDIHEFCTRSFGVTFSLFSKIEVNGSRAHPLYKYLTSVLPG